MNEPKWISSRPDAIHFHTIGTEPFALANYPQYDHVMSVAAPPIRYTPQDLLQLERDELFELVNGQLVEKKMSFLAGEAAGLVVHRLMGYLDAFPVGKAVCEVTFQCFPDDPELVRRPDIAFIASSRAAGILSEGHVRIAPDLAIEIISPGDRINDFEEKLADYRSAGIRLVWEVNPTFRYVRIHRPDRTTVLLQDDDTLTGEDILPGFSVTVRTLLPLKA